MAGSSIFDYVHQGDHVELAEQLGLGLTGLSQGMASPSSSDEGTHGGTMNPDGEFYAHNAHITNFTSITRIYLFTNSFGFNDTHIYQQI